MHPRQRADRVNDEEPQFTVPSPSSIRDRLLKPTPHALHRFSNLLYRRGFRISARFVQGVIFLAFHAVLPAEVEIGKGTKYGHGAIGVVLHPNCKVGDRVLIAQNVTIGGRSRLPRLPVIEDDVFIGTGAKVLGDLTVGRNSIIGANSVVLKSVPAGSIAVGNPARVIKSGINAHEIEDW